MTDNLSGQPSADHSRALAAPGNPPARLRPRHHPQTGDYQIGDHSETGYHTLRLIAVGSLYAVNNCRDTLHKLSYARPDEWSDPIPLSNTNMGLRGLTPTDVMRILTKRVSLPQKPR